MSRYALVQFSAVKGSSGKANVGQFSRGRLFMHDVAVGNARDRDDMNAATRRRFA